MPTNPFFGFGSNTEQQLLQDLIVESIKVYGLDVVYIPRDLVNFDPFYTADDQSTYTRAYTIEMYIKSFDGFKGDGNFLSKFGVEINDQVIFSCARSTFQTLVGTPANQLRPNEGDVIYFPLNNKVFQVTYTEKYQMYYPLGALQTWDITCELFEYSNEIFNTGNPTIDHLFDDINTASGDPIANSVPTAVNDVVKQQANSIIVWSETNPFGDEGG